MTYENQAVIYIVTHPNWVGWLKIGFTADPKQRLRGYNSSVPVKEYTMEVIVKTDIKAAKHLEKMLKVEFKLRYVVSGQEWFKCTPDEARKHIMDMSTKFKTELQKRDLIVLAEAFAAESRKMFREIYNNETSGEVNSFIEWLHTNYESIGRIGRHREPRSGLKPKRKCLKLHFSSYFIEWKKQCQIDISSILFHELIAKERWFISSNKLKRIEGKSRRSMILSVEPEDDANETLIKVYESLDQTTGATKKLLAMKA